MTQDLASLVSSECKSLLQHRETRYFSTWKRKSEVEGHFLPDEIRDATEGRQRDVPFGDAVLALEDTILGVETCEELFTPAAPHIDLALSGVEIISNSSGSHHQVQQTGVRSSIAKLFLPRLTCFVSGRPASSI